ncbi:MAG: hypothetical protein GWQ08_13205 [Verrucomicrobiaceae bacterium]|nr:hypothetical protein [Verrucomicrobiaceae bacterium]
MNQTLHLLGLSLALTAGAQAAPIINEVLSSNRTIFADEDGDFGDWVEIYNPDAAAYKLDGHFLTDSANDFEKWEFPDVEIPAKGYLVVFASGKDRRDKDKALHTSFGVSASGEFVGLIDPDAETVVSSVVVPPLERDQSYIAITDSGSISYEVSNDPTPEAENANNVVIFSITGQSFTNTLTVELSSPSGKPIRYTENGRKATLFGGKDYDGSITLSETAMIAASVSGGPVRTETFIKISSGLANRDSDLPLVVVDATGRLSQTSFEDMAIGVLEPGENGRTSIVGDFKASSRGAIRTRGETSNSFPKKPLRFEFWNEDGDDRDLALLGMPAGSDWILNARYNFDRTLVHNAWIYELSNQIGRYAPRTRFVELYLNDDDGEEITEDDYQGIYTVVEKIERGSGRIEVESMPIEATQEPEIAGGYIFRHDKTDPNTWDFNGGGVSMQMIYPPEEERNDRRHQRDWIVDHLNHLRDTIRNGSDPMSGYPSVIDETAWIDHQLLNLLTLNVDALRLSAYFYKSREGKVIAGPVWDFDRSAGGTSDGRIGNALTWRGAGGDEGTHFFSNIGSGAAGGTPVWWHDLFENPDFHTAWADRWNELRQDEFSDENIANIIGGMGAELAESAERNFEKWPGASPRSANQLTYSDIGDHAGEIQHMIGWLQARAEWITEEIITVPTFQADAVVSDGPVTVDINAGGSLFAPSVVYYTTDGTDPRAQGGEPSANAVLLDEGVTLTETTLLTARKKDDNYKKDRNGPPQPWSAVSEARFFIGEEPASSDNVVVSEIMYNPADPTAAEEAASFDNNDDFEFVELLNVGSKTVSLSGARLRGDADFDFLEGTSLEPGQRLVLAGDMAAFAKRYGTMLPPLGEYTGGLPNSGGRLFLRAHDRATIHEFSYSDDGDWPEDADGEGKALVLRNETSNPDPALANSWKAGAKDNGTPGTDEAGQGGGGGPVEPGTGFSDWLAENFSVAERADTAISGPTADVDGDGLQTLAEYLLGGEPKVSDPGRLPAISREDDVLTVRYSRVKGLTDVSTQVETSFDLEIWMEDGGQVNEVSVIDNGDGTETVTIQDTNADARARYARLRVTQN